MWMETLMLRVPAMTCRHAVRAVTAALRDVVGVQTVEAEAATATVVVSGTMAPADVVRALRECGHPAA
jgi:copper chaperone CopZ